jgi:formate dehydrogenase iron-sulfur subunit
MVRVWKGIAKPLALAALAATAVAGFFHFTRVGPNEVEESDEAAAKADMGEEKELSDEKA